MYRLCYSWFQNSTNQCITCACMGYSVKSNAKMMQVKIYNELYVHKCCAVDIFLKCYPLSSNIGQCQVLSCARACCHGSEDNIDNLNFIKCFSEFTISYESIISQNIIEKILNHPVS